MSKVPKKDVNPSIDLITTVVKDHFLACACDVLGVTCILEPLVLPPGIHTASNAQKLAFNQQDSKDGG